MRTILLASLATAATVACARENIHRFDFPRPGVGCNYLASESGCHMWRDWNPDGIARDLDTLVRANMSYIRVFPVWPDFQPIMRFSAAHGWRRGFGHDDGPLPNEAGVDPEMMRRFRLLCDEADRRHLKVVVAVLNGWLSGRVFVPQAFAQSNVLTDPDAIEWEVKFVRHFVREMKDHPAIVGWDLGNEVHCMGNLEERSRVIMRRSQAWNWMNAIASAIRLEDTSRPVISGSHNYPTDCNRAWSLRDWRDCADVMTSHPYPIFAPESNREPFDCLRNTLYPIAFSVFYAGMTGKPCFIEEFGDLGPSVAGDNRAAFMLKLTAAASRVYGVGPCLWWCAFDQGRLDYPPYDWCVLERELGLFRADRSPKPKVAALREAAAFIAETKDLPPRRIDAVCLAGETVDSAPSSHAAFFLSVQAGLSLGFASADRPLPDTPFYLMPCGKCDETYFGNVWGGNAWRAVRRKVREDGATLLLTKGEGMMLTELEEATGCAPDAAFDDPWRTTVEIRGRKIALSGRKRTLIKPTRAKVLFRDADGQPFMTVAEYGKGKVIFVNCALELMALASADCFRERDVNPVYLVYAEAADLAGVKRPCPDKSPFVSLTVHPHPDGTETLVGLNLSHAPVDAPFAIPAGGWAVRTR